MNSSPVIQQAVRLAFLVADGDAVIVEADDAAVGDGNAEDVAGEIIEHRLLAITPGGAMDNPRRRPDRLGDDQVRPALLERGPELAAHQPGEGFDRDEEALAGRKPVAAVLGNAAAADQAMDMRVVKELLGPGMKHGEYTNGGADEAGIAGKLDDRLGRRLHQQSVAVALVAPPGVPRAP